MVLFWAKETDLGMSFHFLFCRLYACIVFMSYHRFETGKRRYVGVVFDKINCRSQAVYLFRVIYFAGYRI